MGDQTENKPIEILLVEDNPGDARLVREMLAEASADDPECAFNVTHVEGLSQALSTLTGEPFDLVLLDLLLPDSQGLDTVRRTLEAAAGAPVVVISGIGDRDLALTAVKAGAQDHLIKSHVDKHSLPRSIRYAIERKRAEDKITHLNAALRAIRNVNQLVVRERDRDRLLQGACDCLIETRGYYNAWIALLGEGGELVTTAEAGLGEEFLPLVERLERGQLTDCGQRALVQSGVVAIKDPPSTCTNCPLSGKYRGRGAMTVRLAHDDRIYGLLAVSVSAAFISGEQEQSLLQEVAGDIAFALRSIELEAAHRRADEALRESEERLRLVVQNMPVMLDALDADNNFVVWNRECERVTGYSAAEIVGNPQALELLYPDTAYLQRLLAEWGERGSTFRDWEMKLTSKDGDVKTVAWSNISEQFPIPGWATWSVGVDVTGRVRAEEERMRLLAQIQEQARRMQQIMDTVPEGVLLLDADLRILLANPVARQALAALTDKDAGAGEPLTHLGPQPLAEVLARHADPLPVEIALPDPSRRVFEAQARPIGGEETRQWVLTLREVTQERERQQRIQTQERLATVGQLAAGIAHDFNNIMAGIVLYASMLLRSDELSPKDRERLNVIRQQGHHAANLVQQILDFARKSVMEWRPLDLIPFMRELQKLLARTLPENIHIYVNHGHEDYTVNADPTRVQQMIMNLALNARDAMSQGGELRFELSRFQLQPGEPAPFHGMPPGEWVCLTVTDTGAGVPSDALPHIFEPFFTTKEVGKGTGLGLAQVYGIVLQHEGYIGVESPSTTPFGSAQPLDSAQGKLRTGQVGGGATFTIYLPALTLPTPEPVATKEDVLAEGQGEVILVVEDDATTRQAITEILESLGYRVLAAANGQEALALFGEKVALVLSDMVMPEMGGVALHALLKEKHPQVKMVVTTGYPLADGGKSLLEQGITAWVRKPFSTDEIARVVREALK
jgi:two-component system cell cycle sensor histidine kinase/response regulator CckA